MAALLARAFADDPAMLHIFPDDADRAKRLPRLFGLLFDSDGAAGMRLLTAGGEAATMWRAPGRARTGRAEMLRRALPLLHALGPACAARRGDCPPIWRRRPNGTSASIKRLAFG